MRDKMKGGSVGRTILLFILPDFNYSQRFTNLLQNEAFSPDKDNKEMVQTKLEFEYFDQKPEFLPQTLPAHAALALLEQLKGDVRALPAALKPARLAAKLEAMVKNWAVAQFCRPLSEVAVTSHCGTARWRFPLNMRGPQIRTETDDQGDLPLLARNPVDGTLRYQLSASTVSLLTFDMHDQWDPPRSGPERSVAPWGDPNFPVPLFEGRMVPKLAVQTYRAPIIVSGELATQLEVEHSKLTKITKPRRRPTRSKLGPTERTCPMVTPQAYIKLISRGFGTERPPHLPVAEAGGPWALVLCQLQAVIAQQQARVLVVDGARFAESRSDIMEMPTIHPGQTLPDAQNAYNRYCKANDPWPRPNTVCAVVVPPLPSRCYVCYDQSDEPIIDHIQTETHRQQTAMAIRSQRPALEDLQRETRRNFIKWAPGNVASPVPGPQMVVTTHPARLANMAAAPTLVGLGMALGLLDRGGRVPWVSPDRQPTWYVTPNDEQEEEAIEVTHPSWVPADACRLSGTPPCCDICGVAIPVYQPKLACPADPAACPFGGRVVCMHCYGILYDGLAAPAPVNGSFACLHCMDPTALKALLRSSRCTMTKWRDVHEFDDWDAAVRSVHHTRAGFIRDDADFSGYICAECFRPVGGYCVCSNPQCSDEHLTVKVMCGPCAERTGEVGGPDDDWYCPQCRVQHQTKRMHLTDVGAC